MIVVLASRHDSPARAFAAGLGAGATLLTCADLSVKGWRYEPGGQSGTLVADGKRVPAAEVDGVLTRLPAVFANELPVIAREDRSYVAAEMTAFLAAWLTELSCPVLNRPAPLCLTGPYLRPEGWVHLAAGLGIPVTPAVRSVGKMSPNGPGLDVSETTAASLVVNVVGRRCVADAGDAACAAAVAVAEAAGVSLLRAVFTGPEAGQEAGPAFAGADYRVDIGDPCVAAAVAKYFSEGPGR